MKVNNVQREVAKCSFFILLGLLGEITMFLSMLLSVHVCQ